jgi:hypothetical protein
VNCREETDVLKVGLLQRWRVIRDEVSRRGDQIRCVNGAKTESQMREETADGGEAFKEDPVNSIKFEVIFDTN